MAATKRQMNWAPVTATPTTGTASTATGVTQCQVDHGKSVQKFSGDGDHFTTCLVEDFREPTISVTTADEEWVNIVATGGMWASLAATHKDALGATGGNITFTLNNCIASSASGGGAHRAFGSAQVTLTGQSPDGTTSPLGISLA